MIHERMRGDKHYPLACDVVLSVLISLVPACFIVPLLSNMSVLLLSLQRGGLILMCIFVSFIIYPPVHSSV